MKRQPSKMEMYARRSGYDIEYSDLSPELGGHPLADGKDLRIVVNRKLPPPEQDFTIAHELVHCRLHYGQKVMPHKILRELEANTYAWVLLFWVGTPETFAACMERHPLAWPQALIGVLVALLIMAEERAEPFRDKLLARFRKRKP